MRVLLDECVPRPLRRDLAGHDVATIREKGWAGKQNGELLALMAGEGMEVLLTGSKPSLPAKTVGVSSGGFSDDRSDQSPCRSRAPDAQGEDRTQ
jgi:hypothetical protein